MGHIYQAVTWNRQKRIYDLILWGGIVLYLGVFIGFGAFLFPNITAETLLIRATATCAFLLLHIVLSIGPLTRIDRRFLPLLYNRRHMGVSMFIIALVHAAVSTVQFHAFGDLNPILSIFVSGSAGDLVSSFPFQAFGALALLILFLMAATSHDFWLAQLTAPVWKALHMLVYGAYFLLFMHVAFGVLQDLSSPIPTAILVAGAVWLVGLHLTAAFVEKRIDKQWITADTFVHVCSLGDIEDNRAVIRTIAGERVAVFKYDNKLSAVSSVCQHQNGPLGEGRVIDGYITCPWHGYQYCPSTGKSPAPFTEVIPTFEVRLHDNDVFVATSPNGLSQETTPAQIPPAMSESD